jgi:hypothetical protein
MLHREVVWVIFGQFRSMSFVVSAAAVDAVEHVGNALALSKRSGMSTAMLRARDADLRVRAVACLQVANGERSSRSLRWL